MADITPLHPDEEVVLDTDYLPGETPEELAERLGDAVNADALGDTEPPPPSHNPTVGDDVASMAVLITQVAKDFRIKPDLAFKLLELTLNYKLAMRQLTSAPPSFIPPYPTSPETEETTDGDEA